ncbi:MAG: CIA30 family protein [Candidatus Omnitrophica bacterium]|nr:CIA30 family protein [Candidatus Omnitrophota bacterium]
MMSKKYVLLFSLIMVTACAKAPAPTERINNKEVLLDSFENTITKDTVDYGSSNDTKIIVTASTERKVCGNQSLQIEYDLNSSGYMYCARGYGLDVLGSLWEAPQPDQIAWDQYNGISLQVYGSKRGDIAFDVKDNGGEVWRFLIQDDFDGWKEVQIPFTNFAARQDWQPANADGNKVLNFPIKSFQFEPKKPGVGIVNFDCVKAIKKL